MAHKRSYETFEDITDQGEASVHCAVEILSPIKKAKSGRVTYFDGKVTDGKRKLRFVGFDEGLQSKLSALNEEGQAVELQNCQIRRGRTNDFEIHLDKSTTVVPSPKKISTSQMSRVVKVNEIDSFDDGSIVSIANVEIIAVKESRPVTTGVVQDLTIGDDSGTVVMSVWDVNVDQFHQSEAYDFDNLFVRSFRNEKMLTFSHYSSYKPLACLSHSPNETRQNEHFWENEETGLMENAVIIGTENFKIHYSCIKCNKKLDDIEGEFSRCSSCNLFQLVKRCKTEIGIGLFFQTPTDMIMLMAYKRCFMDLMGVIHEGEVDLKNAEVIILNSEKELRITYGKKVDMLSA